MPLPACQGPGSIHQVQRLKVLAKVPPIRCPGWLVAVVVAVGVAVGVVVGVDVGVVVGTVGVGVGVVVVVAVVGGGHDTGRYHEAPISLPLRRAWSGHHIVAIL